MTNKEYQTAKEQHQEAGELYTFEKYNGFFPSRYMDGDDIKELRQANKEAKRAGAFSLEGFNNRAVIIPTETGAILRSYYTNVCEIKDGEFLKLWEGFSVTTLKHINAFRKHFQLESLSKREWIELKTAC